MKGNKVKQLVMICALLMSIVVVGVAFTVAWYQEETATPYFFEIKADGSYEIEAIEKYDITTQGFYITAGYWFNFGWGEKSSVKQKMRPVLRYDFYQKDITAENGASSYYSVGLDWWPEKHLNLHINYTLRNIQKNNKLGHGFNAMLSVKF